MKTQMRPLFTLFAVLMLITGVVYPLLVTGLSKLIFPFQANGSLIKANGQVLGSQLIGQVHPAPTLVRFHKRLWMEFKHV